MNAVAVVRTFVGSGNFPIDLEGTEDPSSIKGFAVKVNTTTIDIFYIRGNGISLTSGRVDLTAKTFTYFQTEYTTGDRKQVSLAI